VFSILAVLGLIYMIYAKPYQRTVSPHLHVQ
jgi:hypothetical protein